MKIKSIFIYFLVSLFFVNSVPVFAEGTAASGTTQESENQSSPNDNTSLDDVYSIYDENKPISANGNNSSATVNTAKSVPDIVAPSACVIDANTGLILYDKNKDQKNYPASITKVMTALLTLEKYGDNLDAPITFSENSILSLPPDSSNIAMIPGETLTVENSLYGLLLASANEVANALAENIAGSEDAFAKEMTQRAHELGAVNTNFDNPNGLYSPNNYTTTYDMDLIMQEAIKYPEFLKIISTESYDIPPTQFQSEPRPLYNSNKMIHPAGKYYRDYIVGGKTGYTQEAQHTLVTYAEEGKAGIITCVMHDDKNMDYADTAALDEYSFSLYENIEVFDADSYSVSIPVTDTDKNGDKETIGNVEAKSDKDVNMYLPNTVVGGITFSPAQPTEIDHSVNQGDYLGDVDVMYGETLLAVCKLYAQNSVVVPEQKTSKIGESVNNAADSSKGVIKIISIVFVIFLVIILIVLLCNRRRKIHKSRKNKKNNNEKEYRYKDSEK